MKLLVGISSKSACICQKYIFNRLTAILCVFSMAVKGAKGVYIALTAMLNTVYTLAAIDKSEFREWLLNIVKISGYSL